jgi:hypothetical protein
VFVFLAACHSESHVARVEIALPLPAVGSQDDASAEGDDWCKPEALDAIGLTASGALDTAALRKVLDRAAAFSMRCCAGDDDEDALVTVTVSPEGYATTVKVSPEESSPAHACVYATFHRVITRGFSGDAVSVQVPLRLRAAAAQ